MVNKRLEEILVETHILCSNIVNRQDINKHLKRHLEYCIVKYEKNNYG